MMENDLKETFQKLLDENIEQKSIEEVLEILVQTFPDEVCFSTSFSFEDQVITDFVKNSGIKIFTLDTGRLFEETYNTWNLTRSKYNVNIKAFYPNPEELEPFIQEKDRILFTGL
jgi:phosphoadenosine phosphosulfate reductase